MKKTLKFSAIGLLVFALAANLHTAIFSYYGIHTKSLSGAVWANSLAGISGSASESSATSTDVTGTSSWYDSPVTSTVQCGAMPYSTSTTNHGSATVSTTTSASGIVSVTVSYGSITSSTVTGTVAAHSAIMKQCVGPLLSICTNTTAVEACQ